MTFSTLVTPARESETRTAGAEACTSGDRDTDAGSIDTAGYRGSRRALARWRGGWPGARQASSAAASTARCAGRAAA